MRLLSFFGPLILLIGGVLFWFISAAAFFIFLPFLFIFITLYFVVMVVFSLVNKKPIIQQVSFLIITLICINLLFFDPESMYFSVYSDFFQYFFVAIVIFLGIIAIIKIFEYFKYNPFGFMFAPRIKVLEKGKVVFVPIRSDDDNKGVRDMLFNFLVNKYTKEEAEKIIQNDNWDVKKNIGIIVVQIDNNNFKTFTIVDGKIIESSTVDKNSEEGKILYK